MSSRAPRILLVENLQRMGRVISLYLLEAGFDVARVNSPEEVSEKLTDASYDLIVFNTGMPPEQKSPFIRRWHELSPGLRVMEISEDPNIWTPMSLTDIGAADRYLPIPFNYEKLAEEVLDCLRQEPA